MQTGLPLPESAIAMYVATPTPTVAAKTATLRRVPSAGAFKRSGSERDGPLAPPPAEEPAERARAAGARQGARALLGGSQLHRLLGAQLEGDAAFGGASNLGGVGEALDAARVSEDDAV